MAILGPFWGYSGAILVPFGQFWSIYPHFQAISGLLVATLRPFQSILGPSWPTSIHLGAVLGSFEAISDNFGSILAHFRVI